MSSKTAIPYHRLKQHSQGNKLQLLIALKRLNFSGDLIWLSTQVKPWVFFLEKGRIVYATGGKFAFKRWQRHLYVQCPHLRDRDISMQSDGRGVSIPSLSDCWEYRLLSAWKAQGEITEIDCLKIIQNVLAEILFDIVQSGNTQHELHRQERSEPRILPAVDNIEQLITQTKRQWETWLNAELEAYFPDSIPIIKQPEAMRTNLSPQAYQGLTALLDGKQSLRDIALRTQRDLFQFTQVLKPYVEAGWIELIEEVAVPEFQPRSPSPPMAASRKQAAPMIACIDDSLMICQSMGQVIRAAGYEFISITDAARAINILLQKRPKLIFLDLIMPETNGYEICSQLRKISLFKETPIIILSGNDGLVDQVRARLLGATDFLSKPMEPIVILNIIQKYLGQLALV